MSKITKKEILDLIEDKNLNENLIITNVDEVSMKEFENELSNKEKEGHFLFDFPLEEVKFVEQTIYNAIFQERIDSNLIVSLLEKEKEIEYLNGKLENENNQHLINFIQDRIKFLKREKETIKENSKKLEEAELLTKYLLACTISEEYVLGKLLEKYSKQKGMIERFGIEFNKSKLEHFRTFLRRHFDVEEFKKSYGEDGTFSLIDRSIANLSFENKVTNWFLNFQNISSPELNKIINSIMTMEMKNSNFVILTFSDNMVSYCFRDSFDNSNHYMEEGMGANYREFSLIKSK